MITGVTSLATQIASQFASSVQNQRPSMFDSIDTNHDGSIDKAELTSFMQNHKGPKGDSVNIDQLFSKIDTNGDGSISKAESDAYQAKMAANRPDMFSRIDTNNDGSISKAEFSAFMSHRHSHAGKAGATAATDSDGDNDGSQSADSLFSAIDTNGDGVISKAELDAYHQKMHGSMGTDQAPQSASATQVAGDSAASTASATGTNNSTTASMVNSIIEQYLLSQDGQLASVNLLA